MKNTSESVHENEQELTIVLTSSEAWAIGEALWVYVSMHRQNLAEMMAEHNLNIKDWGEAIRVLKETVMPDKLAELESELEEFEFYSRVLSKIDGDLE